MTRNENDKTAKRSSFSRNVLRKFFLTAFVMVGLSAGLFVASPVVASADYSVPACPFGSQDGIVVQFDGSKMYGSNDTVGPVSASISEGTYEVTLFSYDGYATRASSTQLNESWYALLENGTTTVATTSPIGDLDDYVASTTKIQMVDDALIVSQNVDFVTAVLVPSGGSVYPVCAVFDILIVNSPPVITLSATTTTITVGDDFDPVPFATAHDEEDDDVVLTSNIIASSTVSTTTVGTYHVDYNVEDSEGEPAETKTLEVIVVEPEEPPTILGCTDSSATNYNPDATEDDGSCTYPPTSPPPSPPPACTGSCGGGGPPMYCGDNICHINETCETCPRDCGVCDVPLIPPAPPVPLTPPAECNYLLEYLKLGADNNPLEVMKLQVFLKGHEGFKNVPLSGFFDQTTFDAVSEFQMKYKDDILTPWGHDAPTGYVYITTKKKVNELYCKKAFPLTSIQEEEIEEFRALLESLQAEFTSEEIEAEFPEIFEEIGQATPSLEVDLADIQLLAELGEREEAEKTEESRQERLLAALNFVADNRLVAVLVALAVFFFFSIFMIWKKTKPENPTYF